MYERIGARDDRLARDYSRCSRQHDHRQQKGFGNQPVERILDRRRVSQYFGALAEIVDQKRREDETKPCSLNGLAPEVAEIRIKGLAAGNHEEYGAKRDQANCTVMDKEVDAVERIDSSQNGGIVANVQTAGKRARQEPNNHDRAEHRRYFGSAPALRCEQHNQNDDRERHNKFAERGACEFKPLHRREYRDRRSDHGVAKKDRRADNTDDENEGGSPSERARRQRCKRERTALAVIVRAQQD